MTINVPEEALGKNLPDPKQKEQSVGDYLKGAFNGLSNFLSDTIENRQEKISTFVGDAFHANLEFYLAPRPLQDPQDPTEEPGFFIQVRPASTGANKPVLDQNMERYIRDTNAKLQEEPDRVNPLIAKAILAYTDSAFRLDEKFSQTLPKDQLAELQLNQIHFDTKWKQQHPSTNKLSAQAFDQFIRENPEAMVGSHLTSFSNLFNAGNGVIEPETNLTNIYAASEARLNAGVTFSQNTRLLNAGQDLPKTLKENWVMRTPPGLKVAALFLAVYAYVQAGDNTKSTIFRTGGILTLLGLGSYVVSGTDLLTNLGMMSSWAYKKALNIYQNGPYKNAFENAFGVDLDNPEQTPEGMDRMQSMLVVGALSWTSIAKMHVPGKPFPISMLSKEAKDLVRYLENPNLNKENQDFKASNEIGAMLDFMFESIGRNSGCHGNREECIKKGMEVMDAKYKATPDALLMHVLLQNTDKFDQFLPNLEADEIARNMRRKEVLGGSLGIAVTKFSEQGVFIEQRAQGRTTQGEDIQPLHFVGGFQFELSIKGKSATLSFRENQKIEIDDLSMLKEEDKEKIKNLVLTFVKNSIPSQIPGMEITDYDLSKGLYTASYNGNRLEFKGSSDGQFYIQSVTTDKTTNLSSYTFNPNTGRMDVNKNESTSSGKVTGIPLTPTMIDSLFRHGQMLDKVNDAVAQLPYGISINNIQAAEATDGVDLSRFPKKVFITAEIVIFFTEDMSKFRLKNDPTEFDIKDLRTKLLGVIDQNTLGILMERHLKSINIQAQYIPQDTRLTPAGPSIYIKDYDIVLPVSTDPSFTTGLLLDIQKGLPTKLYGKDIQISNLSQDFLWPVIAKEVLKIHGDPAFGIRDIQGTEVTLQYDANPNEYAPSILTLDMKKLLRLEDEKDSRIPPEQRKKMKNPEDLKKMIEPLKQVLRYFEGYEVSITEYGRTMPDNYSQLSDMKLLIHTNDASTAHDFPKEKMVWDMSLSFNLDGSLRPLSIISDMNIEQLVGEPTIDTSLTWTDMIDPNKSARQAIEAASLQLFTEVEGEVVNADTSPLHLNLTDKDHIYDSFFKDRETIKQKNTLHSVKKVYTFEQRAEKLEDQMNEKITGVITDADYEGLYNYMHIDYRSYLEAGGINKTSDPNVRTVRYLIMKRFLDAFDPTQTKYGANAVFNQDDAARISKISNITSPQAEIFLQHPVMVDAFALMIVKSDVFGLENMGPQWMKDILNWINDPELTDNAQDIFKTLVDLDEGNIPMEVRYEIQLKILDAIKKGDKKSLSTLLSHARELTSQYTYYVKPTLYNKLGGDIKDFMNKNGLTRFLSWTK